MEIKLKRCPFCGGKAKIQENEDWPDCVKNPRYFYTVGCETDGCICERDYDGTQYNSEIEAAEKWNKRYWRRDSENAK